MPAGITMNPVSAYANARQGTQATATAERPRLTREQTAALTDTIAGMTRGGASSDEITAAVQKQTQGFLETNARAAQPQTQPRDTVELSDAAKRQGTAQEPTLTREQTAALGDAIAGMAQRGASSDEITAAVEKQKQGFLEANAAQPQNTTAAAAAPSARTAAAPQRKGMTDEQIMALRERATAQANRRMGGLGRLGGMMDLRI